MRILYLHQYFNLPSDPGGTRSYEMARRLVAAGHKVYMITSDRRGRFKKKGWHVTCEDGIEVHWLYVPYSNKMSYSERIKAFLRFAVGASIRAATIPADVVFATSTPLTIAIPGIFASKVQRIPMVFEVRDLWPEVPIAVGALKGPMIPLARWLERVAYFNSARIVALSPGMKDGVVDTGYPADKVGVIPNSCDVELFGVSSEVGNRFRRTHEWLLDRPLVLYAGTLGFINGVSWLAELAAQVKKIASDVRFLVVGDGVEREKVKSTARDLGVYDSNFFMIEPVPKREMPMVFSGSTMIVSLFIDLPQMWANSANKFFDALAAAKPIAINYLGWQAELLQKSECGLVLPVNDISTSARRLVKFLNNLVLVKRASLIARNLAQIRFTRDDLAKKLEAVLREAVINS